MIESVERPLAGDPRRGSLLSGWRQAGAYSHLLRNLVVRDLRLKYKGSVFGFLWSLANPLLMLAVYTLAFRYIIRVEVENFPIFFIIGYLPWVFLATSLTLGATSLLDNAALIGKIYFPRQVLPYSVVLSSAIQFLLALACLGPVLWAVGLAVTPALVAVPVIAALHVLFAAGLVLVLSVAHTRYRDTKHFLEIGLVVWFWVTPIVYPLDMVPDPLRGFIALNPMTAFLQAYRAVLLEGVLPSVATLGALVAWTVAALLLGTFVFRGASASIPEML
jgi:ABC-2 type transport system permease protein